MALRFIDGFDHYNSAILRASTKWNCFGVPTISATGGRRSSGALYCDGNMGVSKTLDNQQTWIVGFAYYCTAYGASNATLVSFYDSATTQCGLYINAVGNLKFYRGDKFGTALGTSANTIQLNTWNYIECKVKIANSGGTVEVRVNGSSTGWLSLSGLDTCSNANEYANIIRLSYPDYDSTKYYDDVYIADITGASNNDFLGDVRVDAYYPTGNGTYSQFVGSDSDSTDNYLHLDETSPDNDATYVQSATVGHKDTYAFGDMTHTPSAIFGVQIVPDVKKDDDGARTGRTCLISGATESPGTAQAISTSYVMWPEIYNTDPNTSAAWTKANFNAIEAGYEIAS
jgi:hypothetical protein